MTKNEMSENNYWDNVHKEYSVAVKKNKKGLSLFLNIIMSGMEKYEFYNMCHKYFDKKYKTIFEVGCAPGNNLISFNQIFGLEPSGIEYTKSGIDILKKNFKINNIESNIIYGDFFDKNFLLENKNKYDIVYSLGFIEHFYNTDEVIKNHFDLTKKGGLVFIAIPNFRYINKLLIEKENLKIHNTSIMSKKKLEEFFKPYNVVEIKYIGGLFNIGLFSYKNKILEKIRFLLFIVQRLTIEPVVILLYKLGVDLSNKYTSPTIMVICKK